MRIKTDTHERAMLAQDAVGFRDHETLIRKMMECVDAKRAVELFITERQAFGFTLAYSHAGPMCNRQHRTRSINANHGTLDRLALQPVSCATADFQHTLALGRAKEGAQGGGDTAVIVFNVSTIVLAGDVVVVRAAHKSGRCHTVLRAR